MAESFYRATDNGFLATELTRGPWHNDYQHGGPPSALIAQAIEAHSLKPDWGRLVRLTVEFLRPVPIAGHHEITIEAVKEGRSAHRLRAQLKVDGKPTIHALALTLRNQQGVDTGEPKTADFPGPDQSKPFSFPFFQSELGYHTAIELRLARGEFGKTPTAMWMRPNVPLLEGLATSPFCRATLLADSGNGVSPMLDWTTHGFANPDLTIALVRPPSGSWIALDASTDIGPGLLGLAHTRLFDKTGFFGCGLQNLLISDRD